MISQIFKTRVNQDILFNFLDKVSNKHNDAKYIFDVTSYKRCIFLDIFDSFIESLKPYYHISKQFYLDKKSSFKMLSTIIRQICRLNGIYYKQEIKYSKSTYEIVYHIYIKSPIVAVL